MTELSIAVHFATGRLDKQSPIPLGEADSERFWPRCAPTERGTITATLRDVKSKRHPRVA